MTDLDHERALEAAARAAIVQLGMDPDDSSGTNGEARWQTELPTTAAAVTAYLAALQETHALVPREATIGMLRALVASWPQQERAAIWTLGSFREDYRAMIDAAPPAAQEKK